MWLTTDIKMMDLEDLMFVHKRQLYTPWIILLVVSVIFLIFVLYIILSNIRSNMKNNGVHTYIDLYHEIKLLNRKIKKEPIMIQIDDKQYKCRYKYTIDNKLILVADTDNEKKDKGEEGSKEMQEKEDITDEK